MHAVQQLFVQSKAQSTRPYIGRGSHNDRCIGCRQPPAQCICQQCPEPVETAAFLLIMYQGEVFKPSNTGWLIADVVADCHAYNWSRTEPAPAMLALLNNPRYQPIVIFPGEYALPEQPVSASIPPLQRGKQPLFVILDGAWREACKMYRKSNYLHQLPMLSFSPAAISRFELRTASRDHQLATAEVAALALDLFGDQRAATQLNNWFDRYSLASLSEARRQRGS
ncbi:DTW domain-containing protein [Neiella marina]|uniref:tRNA-uridine aminocarboxypropyltransferase n=1 Tax=Neiella holothuriorum TaxID=2870530 RepID=A0ABS7EE63_9GAMM|nr:DTW domain-containing protein [Neiella holothuriorum]MBW8190223.1 DTW domain-containing protein [Neiella holothuriorum]